MREILFRGKTTAGKEWVSGFYAVYSTAPFIGATNPQGTMLWFEVDPATVGQFTGMTDKNGKKIFEGDILQNEEGCLFGASYRFRVEFCRGRFYGESGGLLTVDAGEMYLCEVIGNIHDNPELMEVQECH